MEGLPLLNLCVLRLQVRRGVLELFLDLHNLCDVSHESEGASVGEGERKGEDDIERGSCC